MSSVRFLPEAAAELLHEIGYYSAARSGLGIRFQAAVETAVACVVRHPLGGAPMRNGARAMRVKGFPFAVIYRPSWANYDHEGESPVLLEWEENP